MALASLVISVLKFIQFQKFVGFQFNIAQVSLLILILASCCKELFLRILGVILLANPTF